tara:strand:+ start:460 stop:609 length:150 start_codon:yes stop_codon:yes gene_type:complete
MKQKHFEENIFYKKEKISLDKKYDIRIYYGCFFSDIYELAKNLEIVGRV